MKGYSYEDALSASLEYFNGEELPARVFVDKYALRNKDNELLEKTPDDMHRRLASEFARIESTKFKDPLSFETIYSYFKNYSKIIPQGSPIFGIGNREQNVSLSNCFVVPSPADSYGGIMQTDQHIVQISKRRGGIGYDISELRPADIIVSNAAKTTSGAVSFMHRFSSTCREVCQDGRRGAMMISMSVHHPQVEDFATIKNDDKSVTGANISLRLSDEFLKALENGKDYEQRWPVEKKIKIKPAFQRMVDAKQVWKTIVHSAWLRAEPGILFWDNILRESPADCYAEFGFKTVSTNPCGEIPLSAYDSCRLMAINLLHCVKNAFTKDAYFDFKELYETAQITQRLMDDLVDLELEAIDKLIAKVKADPEPDSIKRTELELWENVKKSCINGRRTGTGITGLGDVLAALGIKYGSDQSIHTTSQIYQTMKFGSYRSSVDMAKELGPFPIWDWELEKNNPFIKRIKDEVILLSDVRESGDYVQFKDIRRLDERFESLVRTGKDLYRDIKKYGRRNIANLTSAPTGTISTQASIEVNQKLFFNISSGIEPVWNYEYDRLKKVCPGDEGVRVDFVDGVGDSWMKFPVYHSGVSAWMYVNGLDKPDGNPYEGSTANNIDWVQRVKLQAAAQKHVDHSISSTVNLPKDVKEEEVAKIYEAAWKAGCKGITVYRDGCRSGVLVDKSKEQAIISTERPKDLPCDVHHITVKGKQYFVLVGLDSNGKPYEVFSGKNGFIDKDIKTGVISRKKKGLYKVVFEDGSELSPITAACDEQEETITRLTSALLRTGADMHLVVEQLEKVNGEMSGFAKSLSRAVKKYIPDGTEVKGEECPECKSTEIIRQEGCKTCRKCGWSKCS